MMQSWLSTLFQLGPSLKAHILELFGRLKSIIHDQNVLRIFLTFSATKPWSRWGLPAICTAGVLYICGKTWSRLTLNNYTSDMWDWSREVVLITGGCGGIGEQIARKLAERGITVAVLDIMSPKTALPAHVHLYKCDITSIEAIRRTAEQLRKDIGSPTVLINNAGVGSSKDVLEETDEEIERTFNVNILAHFWTVREFLPHMIQRNHGHIVTVASLASFVTIASNVDYSCTKAAALSFHEGLTQELRHRYGARKVRTSIIHPTWVRTPLIEGLVTSDRWNSKTIDVHTVAETVVSQILGGQSGQLFLPGSYAVTSLLKGFPSWLQESIRNGQSAVLRADD
ncbi:SDR family oxidoreductase [Aspergillus affinis]|uniref:SDR family oxidoreductase n=1 Tax=Aspergillus affinis TaxID=1070780 RepID=UPI0022FF31EC|nr:uncharacterized protein KD926_002168 [Aspergillus affinis]KAI9036200.1 hypothetical protein KD926_002168 [Aspergillus affinis]